MKIVGKETLHTGRKFQFSVHRLVNKHGETIQQEFVEHPGAVVLLPVIDEQVVLIRNYRHSVDQVLWELPAGTVQVGEPFEDTAARELTEETGYAAGSLTKLLEFYPAPGASSERMMLFLADDLQPGPPSLEPDEEMETRLVDFDTALAMTRNGEIIDGKTMLGLWHLAHLRSTEGSRCTTA